MSETSAQQPTGHPVVDEVLASLDGHEERPLEEQVAIFDAAHTRLRGALSDPGAPGPPAGRLGA